MSTAQLIRGRGGLPAETTSVAVSRPDAARRLPLAIAGALLLVILYAAFDHGAVALSVNARLQVVIVGIAAVGAVGWLAAGTITLSAPRIAFAGARHPGCPVGVPAGRRARPPGPGRAGEPGE